MVRVGMKVGPFYVSSSTRRRARRPPAAQRRAQAAATARRQQQTAEHRLVVARKRALRRATYGPYKIADVRTWFSWQWFWGIVAISAVAALPSTFHDGPAAEGVWLAALALGLIAWGMWLSGLHAEQAPARRAAAHQAAIAEQQARVEAERQAAAYAAYLAPKPVGNTWQHGSCSVKHRTYDAAYRCTKR